jgi:cell wall-associated NlpC family hydrolase
MKHCVVLTRSAKRLGPGVVALGFSAVLAGCASSGTTATHVPTPKPFPMPNAKRETPPIVGPEAPPSAEPGPVAAAPAAPAPTPAPRPTKVFDSYALVGTALQLRGTPYLDGGASPRGFDCSGFTQYVFAQYGVGLPRSVEDQYRRGSRIDSKDLSDGDLLFFATTSRGPSHVGIVIGSDQFVHAPSSTGVVRVERLSADYWSQRFVGARRVR